MAVEISDRSVTRLFTNFMIPWGGLQADERLPSTALRKGSSWLLT